MPYDETDKILEEITIYIEDLKRFYSNILYVEAGGNKDSGQEPNSPDFSRTKSGPEKMSGKKPHDKNSVVDLFGNVIEQKEDWEFSESLDELNSKICECQKCVLGKSRTKFVFGVGNPKADIVLIGEAPGADEDAQGEPFVGRAGQLLNKILDSVGFKREEVYICNILKCRPPGNRNPMPDEIEKCVPYLKFQIELIKPKLILCLGKFAAETLLKIKDPLNKMRGRVYSYNGIKTMVTFHPAALLRNPQWKRPTWEDMQQIRKFYDEIISKFITLGTT